MSTRLKWFAPIIPSLLLALLYGALSHLLFTSVFESVSSPLSVAFIVIVPFVIGMLAAYFAPPERRGSWTFAMAIATLSMLIGSLLAAALVWEAAICVVMAVPIMLILASVGGLAMWAILQRNSRERGTSVLGLFLFLPFLFAPIEHQFPVEDSFHTVDSQITINADAATVWQNIIRVPRIRDEERPFSVLFTFFGAPKPLEAIMTGEGVGGIRRGQFEDGLSFIETIKVWQPNQRIEWDIVPDNAQVLLPPWNAIGGKPFAVPTAKYWIEPLGTNQVILHLSSTHRLTTRFNGYGGLWTQWGMSEFQNHILQIIKARTEGS